MYRRFRPFHSLLLTCAAVALLVSACKDEPTTPPQNTNGVVTGQLRDEQGYIVPNAVVEAVSATNAVISTDTTDETGAFALAKVPSDRSQVIMRISHGDFKPFVAPLNTLTDQGGSVFVPMIHSDSACAHLRLTITDYTTHQPIEGAEVRLRRGDLLVTIANSDAAGRVAFEYLREGTYNLRISKQGYKVVERLVQVQYCDSVSLDIRMETSNEGGDTCCQGRLRIIPIDSQTYATIIGASVKLTRIGGDSRTRTADSGGVLFVEVCQGEYAVRIAREGYQVQEFNVTMGCNEQREITREMERIPGGDSCCHGVVTVNVIDSTTRNPVVQAMVKLWKGGALVATAYTNANGQVSFPERCNGSYGVSISREGYKAREFDFTLGCNEQYEHTIALMVREAPDTCYTAKLKVRVMDSTTGAWLSGVTVTIVRNGIQVATGTTDAEGWYMKEGLQAPATYAVTFEKTGYQTATYEFHFVECNILSENIRLVP